MIIKVIIFVVVLFKLSTSLPWPYDRWKVRGVNLGGWVVLEKWIVPHIFHGVPDNVDDEYKLTKHLGYEEAEKRLKTHWDSWVTEGDIIEMKNAGINHVRIPIGYWAFEIRIGEPWIWGSWDYVVRAAGWCRKHGIQVMIDLHGAPGSQNGADHSGQSGSVGFFYNDDNFHRATQAIRQIAQWAYAREWRNTVTIIQLLNEPVLWDDYNYRLDRLKQYYKMGYDAVRSVNDLALVAVHDAFIDYPNWYYLRDDPHYWWVMLDAHIYQVFGDEYQQMSCEQHEAVACRYRERLRKANEKLWTVIGEWSLATPKPCNGNRGAIARQQIGVWEESASGWFFWTHNHGQGWADWSFKDSLRNGWIKPNASNLAHC